jgi:hypothetical protein
MNKIITFCLLATMILFSNSCKKDESTPSPSSVPSIIGKWNYVTWEKKDTMSVLGGEIVSTTLGTAKDFDNCTFEVKKDSSFVTTGRYNLVSTLSRPGVSPITTTSNLANTTSGKWDSSFQVFFLDVNGRGFEFYEIESLKANELVLVTFRGAITDAGSTSTFERIVLTK